MNSPVKRALLLKTTRPPRPALGFAQLHSVWVPQSQQFRTSSVQLPVVVSAQLLSATRASISPEPLACFAPEERERLRALPFTTAVSLGPRVLRADTAAIAAMTLWQAAVGDWER